MGLSDDADRHRQIQQRVVVIPERTGWCEAVGEVEQPALPPRLSVAGAPQQPAQHADYVRVHNYGAMLSVETERRCCGVRADAGEPLQFRLISGQATGTTTNLPGQPVQQGSAPA